MRAETPNHWHSQSADTPRACPDRDDAVRWRQDMPSAANRNLRREAGRGQPPNRLDFNGISGNLHR
jgi:hypothetical protein